MTSYIPEYVYSFTGWDERNQPMHGLIPWPKHLTPRRDQVANSATRSGIELTKKGEAYVARATDDNQPYG